MDIMLSDLKKEIQQKVLSFYGYSKPEDLNLDVFPLFIIEK